MNLSSPIDLLKQELIEWVENFIRMAPNFIVALIVVIVFAIASRIAGSLTERVLLRINVARSVVKLIGIVVSLTVIISGIIISLSVLKLEQTVTSVLAGAGIVGLGISLAFQDEAGNIVSGVLIAIQQPYKVGDYLEVADKFGKVEEIKLRLTRMISQDGQYYIIPSKHMFQNIIVNYSAFGFRRIRLEVGISYGDDLEKVRRVTLDAVRKIPGVELSKSVDFYFSEYGDSSINFEILFWVKFCENSDYLSARSEAIIAIKKSFDENDITIPFPISTLDFGIKGGEKLSENMREFKK